MTCYECGNSIITKPTAQYWLSITDQARVIQDEGKSPKARRSYIAGEEERDEDFLK